MLDFALTLVGIGILGAILFGYARIALAGVFGDPQARQVGLAFGFLFGLMGIAWVATEWL